MKQVSHIKHTNHSNQPRQTGVTKPRKSTSGSGIRLTSWHLRFVYVGTVWVALTGLFWFVSHDLLHAEPNDFQRWMLVLHGAGSFLASMIFGSMAFHHVVLGWKMQRNRFSGINIFVVFAVLIISAFLLYYGNEEMHDYVRWTHIIIGLLSFAALPLHIYMGRRNRAKTAHSN